MRLLELFEIDSGEKHVTFCFGRLNPPTIGHEKLLEACASQGGDYKIFVSPRVGTTGKVPRIDNPLDYDTKMKFINEMFPKYSSHIVNDPSLNTIMSVCVYLYDQGYKHVTIVAGDDRLNNIKTLIQQHNGKDSAHGRYEFETIDGVSSGARDPDSEGIEGYSSSKAKEFALNGDLEGFAKATGAGTVAKEMYTAVRKAWPWIKDESVKEHIVKVKGGYELKSKSSGKNLGKYPTRAGAEKRERQVQYFKHAGK